MSAVSAPRACFGQAIGYMAPRTLCLPSAQGEGGAAFARRRQPSHLANFTSARVRVYLPNDRAEIRYHGRPSRCF